MLTAGEDMRLFDASFAEGGGKVITWPDDWTAVMADGGLAAQWEHTVLITPQGHDILTVLPE